MTRLARRVKGAGTWLMLQLMEEAEVLGRQGARVIQLLQGEPDFPTPRHIQEAAERALREGYSHYAPVEGFLDLREAIADKLEARNGVAADPGSEIIVTTGATMGLYVALMALVDAGDEVLSPEPFYGPYRALVEHCGGQLVLVALERRGGHFTLDAAALEERVTERTRVILVNSPSNPTGGVFTREELEAIGAVAERHDLVVVSDECYESLLYDGRQHVSIASLSPELRERTVIVNSFSKTYAMTGWRIGYNVANPEITRGMAAVYGQSGRCAAAFTQRAALAALRGPQDCVVEMLAAYTRRRDLVVQGINAVPGLSCPAPEGAFYAFVDTSALRLGSVDLCRALMRKARVGLTPGALFGPRADGYVRLSFAAADADLRQALANLGPACESLLGAPGA